MIGVFFFHVLPSKSNIPEYVWVIVGDIPPAYIDVDFCHSGREAIKGYVCELQEWVNRVMNDLAIDDSIMPVNIPPEKNWAMNLQRRLNIINNDILNLYEEERTDE